MVKTELLIYKSRYVRGGAKLKNYISYIGTRTGVIKIEESLREQKASKKQEEFIKSLAENFPEIKGLDLYDTYQKNRKMGNASELISYVEETYDEEKLQGVENYLSYIATRPRSVKVGNNGLFTDEDGIVNLEEVKKRVQGNKGVIFTPIVSLTRKDAEAFGYTSPQKWRTLIMAHRNEIARLYRIDPDNFEWYGAFHNEPDHPHIHLVFFSKNGKQGWQNPDYTFEKMKSLLVNDIAKPYLEQVYERKTELRQEIKEASREKIKHHLSNLERKPAYPETLSGMMLILKKSLEGNKGKLQYGYLPPNQKLIVDNIMDELEKDPDVKELLEMWAEQQSNIFELYRKDGYQRPPLSQIKDFRSIKNEIIYEACLLNVERVPADMQPAKVKSFYDVQCSLFRNLGSLFQKSLSGSRAAVKFGKTKEEWEQEIERKEAQGMKIE